MINILITGVNGQLGSELKRLILNYNLKGFFTDFKVLNICDYGSLKNYVSNNHITHIINCAAYNNVDKAEKEKEKALKVNFKGIENIVLICEKFDCKLIHFSTDYVFDGNKNSPYNETDKTNPIGFYGKSKLKGENIVIDSNIDALVIRTSWLYSLFGSNFVKTIIRLGKEKSEINIINDRFGTPTYAHDLAKVCLDILNTNIDLSKKGKLYHYSNDGIVTWYDFAHSIIRISKINCVVNPIQSKDYLTAARRPNYSVLSKEKIKNDFGIKIPKWEYSLKKCLKLFKNE